MPVALLHLPPHSPDLNPIENAVAKLKAFLRKAAARSIDSLWNAVGDALPTFTQAEFATYFISPCEFWQDCHAATNAEPLRHLALCRGSDD
jgi:transposase